MAITKININGSDIKLYNTIDNQIDENIGVVTYGGVNEEISFMNDAENEIYTTINENGIYAKNFYDMNGNLLFGNGHYKRSKWLAMGDSITQGYYSYYKEDGEADYRLNKDYGYASKVAKMTNMELTNIGRGGEGWEDIASEQYPHGARDFVNDVDFSNYDIVTIAYGINDYKGNQLLGDMTDDILTQHTVVANMRYVIETIMKSNPLIKIIIITPLNARGYKGDSLGDESTNYAIGYNRKGRTLGDFFNAMVQVCEYYGILYIDMTYKSPINRKNMITTLPDGVHPSEEAHTMIARQLSKEITYY